MTESETETSDTETNPNFRQKKKFIREAAKRKAAISVTSEHIEIVNEPHNKKGGKVRLVKTLSNGNIHRTWLGRSKLDNVALYLETWKKAGKKVLSAA